MIAKLLNIPFIFLFFSLFFSCARIEKSGYIFEDYDHNNIVKKITSKQTVLNRMGSPTFQTNLQESEAWFYLSEENRHWLFLKPKTVARKLVLIEFNENNIVNDSHHFELSHEDLSFDFNPKKTAVEVHKTNPLLELFGNIGTIKPL